MHRRLSVKLIVFVLLIALAASFTGCNDQASTNKGNPTQAPTASPEPVPTPLPALTPQPEIPEYTDLVEYTISKTISRYMVVQRNSYFNVFGWSENKGGVIYGEFMGEKRYAVVDDNGEWCIQFSPHEYTKDPQTLKIYPTNGKVTEYTDILVGDVWVVSGQSNAELTLAPCLNKTPDYKDEIKRTDNIRLFTQTRAHVMSILSSVDVSAPQKDVVNRSWKWQLPALGSASNFSALGYYFAKELSKVTDVPLGIVMAAAGGAQLHELMPSDLARECGFTTAASVPVGGFYNTLIHPFTRNAITGMLFYQGESEAGGNQYLKYAANLKKTVEAYREIWNCGNFPFINVQLATHMGQAPQLWPQLPEIRTVQYNAYKEIPNSYIVAAYDQGFQSGDPDWAHPYYKLELGKRCASIASAVVYEATDIDHSLAPDPIKVTWNKDHALIDFAYVGDGLTLLEGDTLVGFRYYDKKGTLYVTTAEIVDKDTIKVEISSDATKIGYAMMQDAYPKNANLANSGLIPAPAFLLEK